MKAITFLTLIALALPMATLSAQSSKDDVVRVRSGDPVTGRIKSDDYDTITVTVKGKAVEVARKDVVGVDYGDAAAVDAAGALLTEGKFDQAIGVLQPLAEDKKNRGVLRQQAMYFLAAAYLRKGDAAEGMKVVDAMRTEFPKGARAADAARLAVESAIARKDFNAARDAADKAAREGKGAGLAGAFESEMNLLMARATEGEGKFEAASKAYKAVAGQAGLSPALVAEANLGVARCEIAAGRGDGADATLRALVKQDVGSRLLANAWNRIGDIQAEKGRASKNGDVLLEALMSYLRGVVLYVPLPGESDAELAHALAGSAKVFNQLADIEKDEAIKANYRQLANVRLAELRRLCPSSAEAQAGG